MSWRTGTTLNNQTYQWNQAGRLTAWNTTVSYSYDGDGLRASKTVNGVTSREAWDTAEGAAQILDDGTSQYVWGPGRVPVEQVTAGVATYLHTDQAGNAAPSRTPPAPS